MGNIAKSASLSSINHETFFALAGPWEAVFAIDAQRKISRVNDPWRAVFNDTHWAESGFDLWAAQCGHPEWSKALDATLEGDPRTFSYFYKGETYQMTMTPGPDGGAYCRATPTRARRGNSPLPFDATKNADAARASLLNDSAQLRKLVDLSPSALFVKDAESRYLLANPAFQRLSGKTEAELVGKTDAELFGAKAGGAFIQNDRETLAEGSPAVFTAELSLNGGTAPKIVRTKKTPVYAEDGSSAALFCAAEDVTTARNLENELAFTQETLEQVEQFARVAVWRLELDSLAVSYSPQLATILGLESPSPAPISKIFDLIEQDEVPLFEQKLAASMETGSAFEHRGRLRQKGAKNENRYYLTRACPTEDAAGNVTSFLGFTMETSNQNEMKERLAGAELLLESVFRNAPFGLVLCGPEGEIARCNAEFRSAQGLPTDNNCARRSIFEFIDEADAGIFRMALAELAEGARPRRRLECRVKSGPPGARWAMALMSAVEDADGGVAYISVAFDDVEDMKQTLRQLELKTEEAQAAAQAKSDFLAHLDHVLRNPLNVINGHLHVLNAKIRDPECVRSLEYLKAAARSLGNMLEDVLLFTRKAKDIQLAEEDFDLEQLLYQQIEPQFRPPMEQKKLKFSVESPEQWQPRLVGDPARIGRVLEILLDNAAKFTNDGYVRLEVEQQPLADERYRCLFHVLDSGVGIPKDQIERMFETFEQLDRSRTKEKQGAGLGLTVARKFADLMNAEIQVQSAPGKGSTFTFCLELPAAPDAPAPWLPGPEDYSRTFPPLRALVAEDDEANSHYMRELLSARGWKVDAAFNGKQALSRFLKRDYDLVLMDGAMPQMDGYEAARRIRQIEAEKASGHVPIIAVTGFALPGDREEFLAAGMDDYVTKPLDEDLLFRVIQQHVEQRTEN